MGGGRAALPGARAQSVLAAAVGWSLRGQLAGQYGAEAAAASASLSAAARAAGARCCTGSGGAASRALPSPTLVTTTRAAAIACAIITLCSHTSGHSRPAHLIKDVLQRCEPRLARHFRAQRSGRDLEQAKLLHDHAHRDCVRVEGQPCRLRMLRQGGCAPAREGRPRLSREPETAGCCSLLSHPQRPFY